MKKYWKYILISTIFISIYGIYTLNADLSVFSLNLPEVSLAPEDPQEQEPPPTNNTNSTEENQNDSVASADSTDTPIFPIQKTLPEQYEDVTDQYPIDLKTPENLNTEFEYDVKTNTYIYNTKVGSSNVITPLVLTPEEYMEYSMQKSMHSYYRKKYDDEFAAKNGEEDAFSLFDMKFDLGPAEKIFGPGGVKLQAQGDASVKMAINKTVNGNPTLSERQRKRISFDFDEQIKTNVNASVGDKVNFDLNYNTETTFDFDTKKIKLGYQGKEDEILKTLEAGNVSMNTSNSLIRGGTALFGIKTELQFGKLKVGAIFSQQESESKSVSSRNGVQTTPFEIKADAYDENKHFFLAQYFRDHYDESLSKFPYIKSGISIGKIEVWITNTKSDYDQARNIVAFSDLAEYDHISNPGFVHQSTGPNVQKGIPYNGSNNLYTNITTNYPGAREISTVTQTLSMLEGGRDYEKIESARKLSESEYTLDSILGYISLKSITLQPDQVIAVAYSYKYSQGKVYQVGEFSTDEPGKPNQNLYVKLLKGTSQSPAAPYWDLMMKNVYSLNTYSLEQDKFRLNILYQNDSTGTYLNYISEGDIGNPPQLLLRVMNLDRLDSRQNPYPDGFFDFVEGRTVFAQEGKIIFPVVEPFGSHLRKKINNDAIADKYVFEELYDSTLTVAQQIAEKNKFILQGEYKGSGGGGGGLGGNCLGLNAYNVAPGSVRVTANGTLLAENVDYTVDYVAGQVCLIGNTYQISNVNATLEDQSSFGMQRKTIMGLDLQYQFNPNFSIGATVMNLKEMPVVMKVNMGEESVNNTLYGFNTNYKTESQWLTNMVDKLPLLNLSEPSQIAFSAEYAQLKAGHYESDFGGDYSYIDDFEKTKVGLDLRYPYTWSLSSIPSMFPESKWVDSIPSNRNRALLSWYSIDRIFTRPNSSLTPSHIKDDKIQVSDPYVREVKETELFPSREEDFNESTTLPVLNIAFYPEERGPYNLDADGVDPATGRLLKPKERWGGMMRKIESGYTDFEASNIEYIEFWLLDPFINPSSTPENLRGGDLFLNLGEISEDVLRDEKKFFENGLPIDRDPTAVDSTVWGKVPKKQSLVVAFDDSQEGSRQLQDVGINGLSTDEEQNFPAYKNYLNKLQTRLSPIVWNDMINDRFSPRVDPAGDDYHYYRGSDYDAQRVSILDRYKRYNGTEGNSVASNNSPESYDVSAKSTPDVEDINQDNTLGENEKYFQYAIPLRPDSLVIGQHYITDKRDVTIEVETETGKEDKTVSWYQFKIPVKAYDERVGNISDFKTIRFMRMFMNNFTDSVILRFGTFELVKGDWRPYTQNLSNPGLPPLSNASISVAAVNLEENGSSRKPVSYVVPPGVSRVFDPGQPQIRQENEQSLAMKVTNLAPGDARAVYKNTGLDTRQYKRLQMFAHAEAVIDDINNLQNGETSIFLRLGSDYKNNYYEYEIPLKITPPGVYSDATADVVWPNENMFDFLFEILTDLKMERNKEKREGNSQASYSTIYSKQDPNKPGNKISILGNPSISEIKVIMIGVRNNSRDIKSVETWVNELRLTEFNEDGGWAGNANLNVALSDFATINLAGRAESAGFGGLEQSVMERNLDDYYEYNVATEVEIGKLFPEKANVSIPFYYSYSEQTISPKYDPLNQDVLLKDALEATSSQVEKDSIKSYAQSKMISKNIAFSNVRVDIKSENPMPYDPANFTFGYSLLENNKRDVSTEYERNTETHIQVGYAYSPIIKPLTPFKDIKSKSGALKMAKEFSLNYLPSSIGFNTELSRNYDEIQLRDLNSGQTENLIPVSHREDFYWRRDANIQWNLTSNLNFALTTGTQAQIDAPHVQVNKRINPDEHQLWKDSVLQSIADLGTPLNYAQSFNATYNVPLKYIPTLNWINVSLAYSASYNWDKGSYIEDIETGNTIRNDRTYGINNASFILTNLYNKSSFLKEVNQKFILKKPPTNSSSKKDKDKKEDSKDSKSKKSKSKKGKTSKDKTPEGKTEEVKPEDPKKLAEEKKKKALEEKKKKKFEALVQLSPDSITIVKHQLDNKRMKVTARGANGKLYDIKYKPIDNNSIKITTKDTANIKLVINQLPKLEETAWYKAAQVATRGLMMVRNVNFSYNVSDGMMIPNFKPEIGDFFGQGNLAEGYAPGFDFAFGLADEHYIDKIMEKDWVLIDENNINPASFNKMETFSVKAALEPFTGMRIDLNANRVKTTTDDYFFMYENPTHQYGGTFTMTTVAIGSAFEKWDPKDGYRSKSFDKFLKNRDVIAGRYEQAYTGVSYPNSGFLAGNPAYVGQVYNPTNGSINKNSTDVLVPAFIAAYTGKDPNKVGLSAFPSLRSLIPNWDAKYDGFIQLDFINERFKNFTLSHKYTCNYVVGNYRSYDTWVGNSDGIGFIQSNLGNPIPSSPYEVSSVNLLEAFNPLIGLNAQFKNNTLIKMEINKTRNIQLNATSYQIIEAATNDFVIGTGYRLTEFNKVLKTKDTDGNKFSNDLLISADISYKKLQTLIRHIEDAFTEATSGESQTTIKFSAKYSLSRALTLEAFYDKQISTPLVSSSSYPFSKSSFGVSINVSLSR